MLERIGYTPEVAAAFAPWAAAGDARAGRVLHADRGVVSVLAEDGPRRATLGGGLLGEIGAHPTAAPCPGDWVVLRGWPDRRWTVEAVLPRRTTVACRFAGSEHVLCANADLAAVLVPARPAPLPGRVAGAVGVAAAGGARPVVVLTGPQPDPAPGVRRVAAAAPGIEVLAVDAATGRGLDRLRSLVEDRLTVALTGGTGPGRSELARALVGAEPLGTRETGAGLVVLPGGGAVIDTPAAGGACAGAPRHAPQAR